MTTTAWAPPLCTITVNEQSNELLADALREVTVEMRRGASTTATLVFNTLREESGRWLVQDAGAVKPWDSVAITAHFGPAAGSEELMRGYVREVRLSYPQNMDDTRVTVIAQDELLRLDREHQQDVLTREGEERPDGEIVETLVGDALESVVADGGITAGALHIDSTVARFLRERARANGFELYTREGTLYFVAPQLQASPQPPIRVYAGDDTNCLELNVEQDGHRPDAVRLTRQAPAAESGRTKVELAPDQHILGSTALTAERDGLEPFVWAIQATGQTEQEAELRAQAKANEHQFKIRAEGVLDGLAYGHVLLTHLPVEVEGIGETYGGTYYVDQVTHHFAADAYTQRFSLLRNATNQP